MKMKYCPEAYSPGCQHPEQWSPLQRSMAAHHKGVDRCLREGLSLATIADTLLPTLRRKLKYASNN